MAKVQPIVVKISTAAEMLRLLPPAHLQLASNEVNSPPAAPRRVRSVRIPAADVYALAGVEVPNDGAA